MSKTFQLIFRQSFKFIFPNSLFLGPCNSARAVEVIKKSSDVNLPIVVLRFNTIASTTASSKTIKVTPCFVRVVTYNSLLYKIYCFPSVKLIF
jgi:hypothetical protein